MLATVIDDRETKSKNRQKALGTFVDSHPQEGLFMAWTVSIPDGYTPKGKRGSLPVAPWCHLPPSKQVEFFKDVYIPTVIKHITNSYYFVFEQNKAGNIHMHGLCYVPSLYPSLDLREIQQTLKFVRLVQQIVGRRQRYINLNHIVECNRLGEWIDYLNKDNYHMKYEPIVSYPTIARETGEGDIRVECPCVL